MGKAKSVKNIVSKLSDDVIQEAAERTAKEASNIRTAQISQAVTNANAGIRLDNMDDMLRHRVDAKAAFGSKDFIPSDQVTPFDRLTQQDGGQLSLFDTPASNKPINTTSEYLPRKTTSLNGEEVTVYDKNPNYKKPEKNTPICGSPAAPYITLLPRADEASRMAFTVAPTDGLLKRISPPLGRPAMLSPRISHPRLRQASRCMSIGR